MGLGAGLVQLVGSGISHRNDLDLAFQRPFDLLEQITEATVQIADRHVVLFQYGTGVIEDALGQADHFVFANALFGHAGVGLKTTTGLTARCVDCCGLSGLAFA